MGRKPAAETGAQADQSSNQQNGETAAEPRGQMTSAQRVAAVDSTEVAPEPFGREAKHFTETRVLHRDVSLLSPAVHRMLILFEGSKSLFASAGAHCS